MDNSTQLNLLQGSIFIFPEFETDQRRILYDDTVILTFNHPEDSSLAAMTIKGEDEQEARDSYLKNFDLPELTIDEKEEMSDE